MSLVGVCKLKRKDGEMCTSLSGYRALTESRFGSFKIDKTSPTPYSDATKVIIIYQLRQHSYLCEICVYMRICTVRTLTFHL